MRIRPVIITINTITLITTTNGTSMQIELTKSQLQNIASLAIYYKNQLGISLTADQIIETVLEMAASEACIRREHKRITNDLDARMILAIMGATGKVTYGEE